MKKTILYASVAALALSSCCYVQQQQQERRLDEQYDAYCAEIVPESRRLTELKAAARKATAARVKKMDAYEMQDVLYPFTPTELEELKGIMEKLQELPPVEREIWKAEQRKVVQVPAVTAFYHYFIDLEFLDADGKVLGTFSLTSGGAASTEEADSYRLSANRAYRPDYMLPPEELKRFKALPPLRKAGK